MANETSEESFINFLEKAGSEEMEIRPEPECGDDLPALSFSEVAQAGNKETRGVLDNVLGSKSKSDAAEKALISNVLNTRDFETSNNQIKPVEKVSFPRSQSLMETVIRKCGRL